MKKSNFTSALTLIAVMGTLTFNSIYADQSKVGKSPWGPDDEIGRLNLMTEKSKASVLSRISGGEVYDLSVEYFMGMPGWFPAGDPRYTFWMTHTPQGTVNSDPMNVGREMNEHVSYSGSAISMYTHTGTHIDALNDFGLDGKIYNGFEADIDLGDRGWNKTGAETIPPIVARGVLIDVAADQGVDVLPPNFRIGKKEIQSALKSQNIRLASGDVVLIRTGKMVNYNKTEVYLKSPAGLGMTGARYLVEQGAMVIGGDNLSLEAFPSEIEGNYLPVHTYLLAQHGIPIMELVNLEKLSEDKVYQFAFIGGSLKLRGADAGPMRPIAIRIK